jgi:hypothetical protein
MRRLSPIVAFLWACVFALAADAATSAVHIEWRRGTTAYGGQSLTSAGASALSAAAPNFDASGTAGGVVHITPTQGASIVVVSHTGAAATQTNGFWLAPGSLPIELPVSTGDQVAIIAAADQPTAAVPAPLVSTGFQQVASFSAATGFTPPAGSTVCYIQPEGNAVRFRADGTNPTASIGTPLAVGAQLVETASLAAIRFIPQTGSASLDIECFQ